MAFRTDGLGKAYQKIQGEARRAKNRAVALRDQLIAGNVNAESIIDIMSSFKSYIDTSDEVSSLSGMTDFAKAQEDDPTYDVIVEFTAARIAAIAAADWVVNNFPQSAGGFMEKETIQVDYTTVTRTFPPAQTTGLQVVLLNFINAID